MKIKVLLIIVASLLIACQGISKTGRAIKVKEARIEANKKAAIPSPETIKKQQEPNQENIQDIVTPEEQKSINKHLIENNIPKAQGNLIQVEGLVVKEVRALTIDLNTSSDQLEQITAMKAYVQEHWHYVNDPQTGKDTWRSAEATLALKYKNKYTGDCDDFAILLASFAKQIGLEARVVAGYNKDGGHAFAEFLIEKQQIHSQALQNYDYRLVMGQYWVSLDWFKAEEHNKYLQDAVILTGI
ncbi:Transglutaminase-like superfamily protein [Pustulibacterium marinum]|uniref:Transglutaminase-like superfamily protein n=1 Tax=Pustulibacterium marinum TaxID=1224947 RepID=A0A1I7GXX8_9FLAO|nr:transglutaminase-like domain-containing protein [Pustulibacterium marinum]SFU53301.1 Transglutaminase-like superfamily protein [Pustulibacterium marinum]